jgi:hypothetical protein
MIDVAVISKVNYHYLKSFGRFNNASILIPALVKWVRILLRPGSSYNGSCSDNGLARNRVLLYRTFTNSSIPRHSHNNALRVSRINNNVTRTENPVKPIVIVIVIVMRVVVLAAS